MVYLVLSKETDETVSIINIKSCEVKKYENEHPDIYVIPFQDLALPEEDLMWE